MQVPSRYTTSAAASGAGAPRPGSIPARPEELESSSLLNGHREIRIRHGNDTYRLRHTRNDKLILTK